MKALQITTVIVVVWSVSAGTTLGGAILGPIVNPANDHPYYLLEPNCWMASEAEAVSLGGHLATINDQAEQDWVVLTFALCGKNLWIGFNDAKQEGNFAWVSGEPVTYTNWSPGEPNNADNEDYGAISNQHDLAGRWNDFPNAGRSGWSMPYGLVEVPEPGTLSLLALGGLFVLCRRRTS